MRAIEKIVQVDDTGLLTIDTGKQFQNKQVRVLILVEDELDDDKAWYRNALKNDVFSFLNDETENIYTIDDGKPFVK